LVSVVFVAKRGLAFRRDENVGSPKKISKKFETFFKQIFEKEDAMLLASDFATVSQITNRCQILYHGAS